jgi:hypothetical protein
MTDAKAEFWGDLQVDLMTQNTAMYLANTSLEGLIRQDGRKAHKPILSIAKTATYVPYSDMDFEQKTATKQTLEVDTPVSSAVEIDDTDETQTQYDLTGHSAQAVRKGLLNRFEQVYLSKISDAYHSVSRVKLDPSNVLDIFEEVESKLGTFDVPFETSKRAGVFGPHAIATMRRAKKDRDTAMGDTVYSNGVIGPWSGFTMVQNNNLPWTGTLKIATEPLDGETVTIAGQVFTFKTTLGTTPGQVLIGASDDTARANLKLAVEGGEGAGTNYIQLEPTADFIVRTKRYVRCTSAEDMVFTGHGDIVVSETLTAAADVWSNQTSTAVFMIRGAIDAVMQLNEVEVTRKEKGFANLVKGLINVGAKVFTDGSFTMVKVSLDASDYR